MTSDSTVLFITVLGIIPAHILTFGAAWAIVTSGGKRPFWNSLGWSFGPRFGLIPSAGLAVALYVVGSLLAKLIGGGPTDIDVLVNSTLAVRVVLAIVATFGAPIVEELVYRGIIYPSLEKVLGMAWAVAIVSFLFAFVHLLQYRNSAGVIAVIVLLGISLTLVRAFTGRLLPCVIIHAVFNGIISILIIFQPYLAQFEKGAQPKTSLVILWRMMRVFI
jgi:membrane protease YdiL (CAAX protease family)